MKSRDEIERQLCHILLDSAQAEQDATGEFMVPVGTLPDLLPAERRLTAADARHAVGIGDRIWEQELRRHLVVADIMHGVRKSHRRAS
jgi:hypothetical protein